MNEPVFTMEDSTFSSSCYVSSRTRPRPADTGTMSNMYANYRNSSSHVPNGSYSPSPQKYGSSKAVKSKYPQQYSSVVDKDTSNTPSETKPSRVAGIHPAHFYNNAGRSHSSQVSNPAPPSGSSVVLRRPKENKTNPYQYPMGTPSNSASSSSNRRHGMYLPAMRASLAVMTSDEGPVLTAVSGMTEKPPLPPSSSGSSESSQPRAPPRTRPKSWTSSLFNVMKTNHKSVNFQSVVEEQHDLDGSKYQPASAEAEPKFYSLPRNGQEEDGEKQQQQLKFPKPQSRTPSPFRTIMKGIVKGEAAMP